MIGWIKLHRKLADKAFYTKDSEMVHLWVHLLFCANHKGREESLGGKPFQCKPGQFTTGRKQLSKETGISESKIERILFKLEKIEQQIEQQKMSTNRLISILNWDLYQTSEQPFEQQVNNDRTTSEQQVNTPKEVKKGRNKEKELCRAGKFVEFVNKKLERKYQLTDKVKAAFNQRITKYEPQELVTVVEAVISSTHHIESDFKYCTPEFLLRQETIERYKNGAIVKKEIAKKERVFVQ